MSARASTRSSAVSPGCPRRGLLGHPREKDLLRARADPMEHRSVHGRVASSMYGSYPPFVARRCRRSLRVNRVTSAAWSLVTSAGVWHRPQRGGPRSARSQPCRSRACHQAAPIASHCESYSVMTSATIRTARSRISDGYLLGRPHDPRPSQTTDSAETPRGLKSIWRRARVRC